MDKQQAFEKLEGVRPDSDDLRDPEFADAARIVESDADWEAEFHQRMEFDRCIGQAMRDVPVPEGLRETLLLQAGLATEVESAKEPPQEPSRKLRSRRALLVVAASIFIGLGLFAWLRPAPLSTQFVENEAPVSRDALAALKVASADWAALPSTRGLGEPGIWQVGSHQAALFPFGSSDGRGKHCVLLVLPAQSLASPSELMGGATRTILRGSSRFIMTGWSESGPDSDCVCVLLIENGSEADLQREIRRLRGTVA